MLCKSGNITLLDVGRAARVSVNTAAKVLAGQKKKARISEATAQRVLAVAQELGYVPNMLARNLRAKRTSAIGVFVADMTESVYVASSHIILKELHNRGFLPFLTVGEIGIEYCRKEWLYNRIVGLILCGTTDEMTESFFKELRGYGITPVIAGCAFGEPSRTAGVSIVCTDNYTGIEQAITHLHHCGRSRIAYISGPQWHADAHERCSGYVELIQHHHQPIIAGHTGDQQFWRRGYAAAGELAAKKTSFDAIIAYDDQMAIGAMKWLTEHKIRIPVEVAVVGFDNAPESEFCTPALTSISQAFEAIGQKSVDILESSIYADAEIKRVRIMPKIIIRESTRN